MLFDQDVHIHTLLSGHSAPDMMIGAIVHEAEMLGLRRIVILEHIPDLPRCIEDVTNNRLRTALRHTLDAVQDEVAYWRAKTSVEILNGVEVDADPHDRGGRLLLEDMTGVDVVLASFHFLPGSGLPWFDPRAVQPERQPAILQAWVEWVCAVAANPVVDIFAHPGLSMMRSGMMPIFDEATLACLEPMLAAMAAHGVAFELNEGLPRRFTPEQEATYPAFCRRAKAMGVRFVIGSDAHERKRVGRFDVVRRLAADLDLQETDLLDLSTRPPKG